MLDRLRNNGFSLTEVLMAAGILAIGFAFIAGMFPVGVKLTAITTEQTIAPIVVDEAIAKIKLYGKLYNELDSEPNLVDVLGVAAGYGNRYVNFSDIIKNSFPAIVIESEYPSTDIKPELKKYHWSALCSLQGDGNVHVIVFVSRKAGAAERPEREQDIVRTTSIILYPAPAMVRKLQVCWMIGPCRSKCLLQPQVLWMKKKCL